MAAAVLPCSRGLATVRTSKTLLLIFSLLSLVHVSSSLLDQHTLEQLKRNLQTLEEQVARKKAQHKLEKVLIPEVIDDLKSMMDHLTNMVMKLMPDFTAMPELIKDINGFFESCRPFYAKMYEDEAALIKDNEEKLRGLKERITSLEEHQAEL